MLFGFAACLRYPPKFLGKFTIAGEASYAFYAIHVAFLVEFGLVGLLYAFPVAFGIEFALRRKEITRRLKTAYMGNRRAEVEDFPEGKLSPLQTETTFQN